MPRSLVIALSAVVVVTTLGTSGCTIRERVCGSDEYPVRTVDPTNDGSACAAEGEDPPAGYERYPAGEVPEYVDEMYPE